MTRSHSMSPFFSQRVSQTVAEPKGEISVVDPCFALGNDYSVEAKTQTEVLGASWLHSPVPRVFPQDQECSLAGR